MRPGSLREVGPRIPCIIEELLEGTGKSYKEKRPNPMKKDPHCASSCKHVVVCGPLLWVVPVQMFGFVGVRGLSFGE